VPKLRERAERCERERRVPEESIRELKEAGLFRILQPRAYGGYELGFETYVRVATELGRGCASTAWVYENNAMHQLILAHFPRDAEVALGQRRSGARRADRVDRLVAAARGREAG
jgi:GTP cyclohydrolase II